MAKVINCRDAGVDCDWTGKAETEEELLQKVVEHARNDHGIAQLPPPMMNKAKSIMRDE
jgi:predicted small metal-binding protein